MPATNTRARYGTVTKTLHWVTALMIVTLIPTGIIANQIAHGPDPLNAATLFSVHKTLGIALFAVALVRVLWAVSQPKCDPLHPDRRAETFLAELVHWLLYASLIVVPLSGWVSHAASEGFAPIWWPLGQNLPLVPESEAVKEIAGNLHVIFERVLVASLLLHVAGAVKHAVIDRDGTLARMWFGAREVAGPAPHKGSATPVLAALGVYALALGIGGALGLLRAPEAVAAPAGPALAEVASEWRVTEGTLEIGIVQFGSALTGSFADWTAEITYDPGTGAGAVEVTIAIASVTLGSVTSEALGADWFGAETFPTATYSAAISGGALAEGTLTLKGAEVPVSLPFELTIEGETATMTGATSVDRAAFGIGDEGESTVGRTVDIAVSLTAVRGGGPDEG